MDLASASLRRFLVWVMHFESPYALGESCQKPLRVSSRLLRIKVRKL